MKTINNMPNLKSSLLEKIAKRALDFAVEEISIEGPEFDYDTYISYCLRQVSKEMGCSFPDEILKREFDEVSTRYGKALNKIKEYYAR